MTDVLATRRATQRLQAVADGCKRLQALRQRIANKTLYPETPNGKRELFATDWEQPMKAVRLDRFKMV